jgi:hypothetical protein
MTSARKPDPRREEDQAPAPVEPADWVKPVELIELIERRTAKRKQPEAPTSSPFYDAEFVASRRKRKKRGPD